MTIEDDNTKYDHSRKVSRLPPLPETLDPVLKERFDATLARGGKILNLHRVSGHAPILSKLRGDLTWALRTACIATRQMREMAIVFTAYQLDCAYELDHHLPLAERAGLSQAQIEGLKDWRANEALFEAPQHALLAYLDEMYTNRGDVSDETFQTLLAHFSPQEIVELTLCATSYHANALFVKALGLEIDEPHVKAAPGNF